MVDARIKLMVMGDRTHAASRVMGCFGYLSKHTFIICIVGKLIDQKNSMPNYQQTLIITRRWSAQQRSRSAFAS
jgi:hypothetical protein